MAGRSDQGGCFSTVVFALIGVGLFLCYKNKERLFPPSADNAGEFVNSSVMSAKGRIQSKDDLPQDEWNTEAKRALVNLGISLNKNDTKDILTTGIKCQILAEKIEANQGSNNLKLILETAWKLADFYSRTIFLEQDLNQKGAFAYDAANSVQKVWGEFTIKETNIDKTDAGWCKSVWRNHGVVLMKTTTGTNAVGSSFTWPFYVGVKIGNNRECEPCLYQNGEEAVLSLIYQWKLKLCELWPEDTDQIFKIIADQSSDGWNDITSNFGMDGKVDPVNVPISPAKLEVVRQAIRLTVGSLSKKTSSSDQFDATLVTDKYSNSDSISSYDGYYWRNLSYEERMGICERAAEISQKRKSGITSDFIYSSVQEFYTTSDEKLLKQPIINIISATVSAYR